MKDSQNTTHWMQEFTVSKDGFYGQLYLPDENLYPGKAVLVLGGGGVPYQYTLDEAAAFAGIGITSLALGYFGVPETPKTIIRVPVEYVECATDKLHEMGIPTVIAAGISKGAELALVSASLLPQINAVIAFSPSSRVNMGIGNGISWVNASSWTFRGKELPYAYAPYSGWKAIGNTLCARELTFRPAYEKANLAAAPDSSIPVEQIRGPILLAASESDSLWPSAEACREITARLEENNFPYPHQQWIYRYASHLLLPFPNSYGSLFRIGRKYPDECRKTVLDLQSKVLEWLKLCKAGDENQ